MQVPHNSALSLRIAKATSQEDYLALGLSSWQAAMAKYSVSDCIIIQQQLKSKLDARTSDLKHLINTSYRDLLGTTDDIQYVSDTMATQHEQLSALSHGDIKREVAGCDRSVARFYGSASSKKVDPKAIESALRSLLYFNPKSGRNILMARLFYLSDLDHDTKSDSGLWLHRRFAKELDASLVAQLTPEDFLAYCIFHRLGPLEAFQQVVDKRLAAESRGQSLVDVLAAVQKTLEFAHKYLRHASFKQSILYQLESAQFSGEGTLVDVVKSESEGAGISLLLQWTYLSDKVLSAPSTPVESKYSRDTSFPDKISSCIRNYASKAGVLLEQARDSSIKACASLDELIGLLKATFSLLRESRVLREEELGGFTLELFTRQWKERFHAEIQHHMGSLDYDSISYKESPERPSEPIISFNSPLVEDLAKLGARKAAKIDIMSVLDAANKVTWTPAFAVISQYEDLLSNVADIGTELSKLKEVFSKSAVSDYDDDEDDEWNQQQIATLEKEYSQSSDFVSKCVDDIHKEIRQKLETLPTETVDQCKYLLQICLVTNSDFANSDYGKLIETSYERLAQLLAQDFVISTCVELARFESIERVHNVLGCCSVFTSSEEYEKVFQVRYGEAIEEVVKKWNSENGEGGEDGQIGEGGSSDKSELLSV